VEIFIDRFFATSDRACLHHFGDPSRWEIRESPQAARMSFILPVFGVTYESDCFRLRFPAKVEEIPEPYVRWIRFRRCTRRFRAERLASALT
jgi:hypothetical protein